ncbi:uncharacterized protein LOC141903374 [Tubulanus polymorphus]|uniref:uncharacterized protein LOC141903374 n=1 Tax=Tubulanus polymorphus TaxID=672921 RepID=UPI003DA45C3E
MDATEMSSLKDIFKELSGECTPETAEYELQFLWRDLSSDFDIIGPYFNCHTTMDAAFTTACLYDVLRIFYEYGFRTRVVVTDGASTNLSMIKTLSGYPHGAFGLKDAQEDRHKVEPWMMNPHEPEKKIYFVICPSHQLKNQINQLWASQTGGTKNFMNGVEFGWDEIKSMWNRETQRRDDNHIRMVPGLIKSYIERDSWTKLNVKPAKIMQQPQVLAELYSYANPDNSPIPLESEHVMATRSYLVACSQLFEEGLLKSRKPNDMTRNSQIHDMESPIILNISEGYKYFRDWCEYLHHECE